MNSLNAISNINDNNTTNVTISSGSVSTKSLKKDCTNMSKEEVNENIRFLLQHGRFVTSTYIINLHAQYAQVAIYMSMFCIENT